MTHNIVIVGGGAGGLELATRVGKTLGKRGIAKVTLVDVNLTHIWKPLLHEVAAGSMNSSENEINYVAQAKWNHFEFQLGRMNGVDREQKKIQLAPILDNEGQDLISSRELSYDTLVIAIGSLVNDFGIPGAAEHCIFLDTRKQAEHFHQQLLGHYLRAHARQTDEIEQISIAIVGAGATGVELAAELHNAAQELASYGLGRVKPENMHITLIEAGPRVLPALTERISMGSYNVLKGLGVTVLTKTSISKVTEQNLITTDGKMLAANIKVWAAGVRAPNILKGIVGLETNSINQLKVFSTLQTTRDENIFAFGDCAACPQLGSKSDVPPRAQAAHQQASLLAISLKLHVEGKKLPRFKYYDYGSLVSLSRFSAIGNLMSRLTGSMMLEGWLARMFYLSLYRLHQIALFGFFRAAMIMLGGFVRRGTDPKLKLH